MARTTPYERSMRASMASYRRWYKADAPDMSRVDKALQLLAGIVGDGFATADYEIAMKGLQIMLGYERLKIMLNQGVIKATATPATPEQLEDQAQIEKRLRESLNRRRAKLMPTIEEAMVVKPT